MYLVVFNIIYYNTIYMIKSYTNHISFKYIIIIICTYSEKHKCIYIRYCILYKCIAKYII